MSLLKKLLLCALLLWATSTYATTWWAASGAVVINDPLLISSYVGASTYSTYCSSTICRIPFSTPLYNSAQVCAFAQSWLNGLNGGSGLAYPAHPLGDWAVQAVSGSNGTYPGSGYSYPGTPANFPQGGTGLACTMTSATYVSIGGSSTRMDTNALVTPATGSCPGSYTSSYSGTTCLATPTASCGSVLSGTSGYYDAGTEANYLAGKSLPQAVACIGGALAALDNTEATVGVTYVVQPKAGVNEAYISGQYVVACPAPSGTPVPCIVGTDAPAAPSLASSGSSEPTPTCSSGQTLGQVNGANVCANSSTGQVVAGGTVESSTTSTTSAPVVSGGVSTVTINNSDGTTTIVATNTSTGASTTTVQPNPGGDVPGDTYCKANPNATQCAGGTFNESGNCTTPPICTGDPQTCGVAYETWKTHCDLEPSSTDTSNASTASGVVAEGKGTYPSTYGSTSYDLDSALNSSGYGLSSSCPDDPEVTIFEQDFTLPLHVLCDPVSWVGDFNMAAAWFWTYQIIMGMF